MLTILGVDPGLADTGIGLISGQGQQVVNYAYGSVHTDKSQAVGARLDCIYRRLCETLDDVAPDLMVVEDVFSLKRFPESGILLGKVTGVVLLAGQRRDPVSASSIGQWIQRAASPEKSARARRCPDATAKPFGCGPCLPAD